MDRPLLFPPIASRLIAVALLANGGMLSQAAAGVVVLENRTDTRIEVAVRQAGGTQSRLSMLPGDVTPAPASGPIGVAFYAEGQPRQYLLQPNSIHCFMSRDKKLDLFHLALPGEAASGKNDAAQSGKGQPAANGKGSSATSAKPAAKEPGEGILTIPVMILCDDHEPMARPMWEKKIRQRVADASAIFEHACGVRFQVTAVGEWTFDQKVFDLQKTLEDFERKVRPAPARLAIGFTGQIQWLPGERHLGGTHGPLNSHIMIRESLRNVSEPERLEVLVHELGHFLGAVHTLDNASVMRPLLADRQSRLRAFRIGFDAPNTLAMNLLAEELSRRPIVSLCQVPPESKATMRSVYALLDKAMPQDRAAARYLALLDLPPPLAVQIPSQVQGLVGGTRGVVQAVVQAARQNQHRPLAASSTAPGGQRLSGDELTERYVRAAAEAARRLPPETAAPAFLLGLGIALDDSSLVRDAPLTSRLWRQIEPDADRRARLAVLGEPSMRGRRDAAQHFAVSAALVVVAGAQGAEMIGILKEVSDANGGAGFSFPDLAADLAGVTFALRVRDGKIALATLGKSFATRDFLPETAGLKEGLAWKDCVETYGGLAGERFQKEVQAIRTRILALPGHRLLKD
jgi:hypothetical protein